MAADVGLMFSGLSANAETGNYFQPLSFEFDSVADGGAPIKYDATVLAGDDSEATVPGFFAAAEIECWQL